MTRLPAVFVLAFALGGCFLFPSFPDNDPLTEGLHYLWERFALTSVVQVSVQDENVTLKWAITDNGVVLADGVALIPLREFAKQTYEKTRQYAFREAVKCINHQEETKPCKTRQ